MSSFPRVYTSFSEFEREELRKLDSLHTSVSDMVEERFSEELDFGGTKGNDGVKSLPDKAVDLGLRLGKARVGRDTVHPGDNVRGRNWPQNRIGTKLAPSARGGDDQHRLARQQRRQRGARPEAELYARRALEGPGLAGA